MTSGYSSKVTAHTSSQLAALVSLVSFPAPKDPCRGEIRWFHVLMECAVPLILGEHFLDETEVLTKNKHLLERCPIEFSEIPSLTFIGTPRSRSGIGVSVDGRLLVATPDTGSDLNLISLQCAKREGFHINTSPEGCVRLRIADGSEVHTVGQVCVSSEPELETGAIYLECPDRIRC
jgi:hypothetical protein